MKKFLESLGLWVSDNQFSFGCNLDLYARFIISSHFAAQKFCQHWLLPQINNAL